MVTPKRDFRVDDPVLVWNFGICVRSMKDGVVNFEVGVGALLDDMRINFQSYVIATFFWREEKKNACSTGIFLCNCLQYVFI